MLFAPMRSFYSSSGIEKKNLQKIKKTIDRKKLLRYSSNHAANKANVEKLAKFKKL